MSDGQAFVFSAAAALDPQCRTELPKTAPMCRTPYPDLVPRTCGGTRVGGAMARVHLGLAGRAAGGDACMCVCVWGGWTVGSV